jgi:peptidoglycan/xylan/chitin deacetylase (PgdA/CDA1 family)
MTVTMASFEEQLHILREDGFHIIPLADLVSMLGKPEAILPSRSVVITSDDGHESVYQEMFPIILKNNIPMTLFIYPSAISNANYAMTWAQLREMRATGLVDIQSHTYWHPNFAVERRRLSTDAYRRFVTDQLLRSKRVLEQKLGSQVNLLAWPFGIYDADLIGIAKASGYIAAMTIERRPVTIPADPMTLPRYIVMNNDTGTRFRRLLSCPR